jgi:hypothetical protein
MNLHRRSFLKQLGLGAAGLGLVSSWPFAERRGRGGGPAASAQHAGRAGRFLGGHSGVSGADPKEQARFHSFMLVRHGHVIAEGWWTPYRAAANGTCSIP